jgi:hypothetical protein
MSFAIAAATTAVVGAAAGAVGSAQQASAIRKASKRGQRRINEYTDEQVQKSDDLAKEKQDYLESGDPFAEMGNFIFGGKNSIVYSNLRKSQLDFSNLAAGNTSDFSKEVSSMVRSALAGTFGSPKGSFENLSAKNLFNFRQQGANTAMGLSDYFTKTGTLLTQNKFGILDQNFERQMKLKEQQVHGINQAQMQSAQTQGTEMAGVGNVLNAFSGAANSYNQANQMEELGTQNQGNVNTYLNWLTAKKDGKKSAQDTLGIGASLLGKRLGAASPMNQEYQQPSLPAFGLDISSFYAQKEPAGSIYYGVDKYTNDTSLLPDVGVLPTY